MCLDIIDAVKQRHRVGYKIIKTCDENPNIFQSTIFRSTYLMNEWYSVGDPEKLDYELASRISPEGRRKYPAGIHYYHTFPLDEWNRLNFVEDGARAVIKVKLKGVIVTGMECGLAAGVCTSIYPFKISEHGHVKQFIKENLQKLLDITDAYCYYEMFQNRGADVANPAQIQRVAERATKSPVHFANWITFLDAFSRKHLLFKFYTGVHMVLHLKDKKYKEYYERTVKQEPKLVKAYDNAQEACRESNICIIGDEGLAW